MDWTEEVLNGMGDGKWARNMLDAHKNGVYEMCDNLVAGGAEVDEAAVFVYCTLAGFDSNMSDLFAYYIDMWQEEREVG
jgi:hypothetical protein